jgi:Cu2+-exporting ATPase
MARAEISKEQTCCSKLENKEAANENDGQRCADDLFSAVFGVEGIHCTGCIQKIESGLKADALIDSARVNFSSKRLYVDWHATKNYEEKIIEKLAALGFKAFVYDRKKLESLEHSTQKQLLLCLAVAGFAAGNIMLLSFALWGSSSEEMGAAMRGFFHLVSALIAVPSIAYAGRPFFRSAFKALMNKRTNMDVPISLALLLTVVMSLLETFRQGEHVYFDSAVMLLFFLLVGRYLDSKARARARGVANELVSVMEGNATVIDNGQKLVIGIRDIKPGMNVIVPKGERVPVNSALESTAALVDTSIITGESLPQHFDKGALLYAGAVNVGEPIVVKATHYAESSFVSDILSLMERAEQTRSRYVEIAERAARMYTPVVHLLAFSTFVLWGFYLEADWQSAMMVAVTVLIITCPCALGLAVPVVQVLAVGNLMKKNVLVKSGNALERLSSVDIVIFDKTGTLTFGQHKLSEQSSYTDQELKLAASLAAHSSHPLSRALSDTWKGPVHPLEVNETPGKGLEAMFEGKAVRLGSFNWCGGKESCSQNSGDVSLWLGIEGRPMVSFDFEDMLREDSAAVIEEIKSLGLKVFMASGDTREKAVSVARALGIDEYKYEVSPEDKYNWLRALQGEGHKVLCVGDGLNDAPLLKGADCSMSPSSALEVTKGSADIVFTGQSLMPVAITIKTAIFAQKLVKQNFLMAVIYNCLAVPFAIAGLVTPLLAAISMSASSLVVTLNSYRLNLLR